MWHRSMIRLSLNGVEVSLYFMPHQYRAGQFRHFLALEVLTNLVYLNFRELSMHCETEISKLLRKSLPLH